MPTTIYFIRHAQSPFSLENYRKRPLSEKGKEDAERVATLLKDRQIDAAFSSSSLRAIQTIQPLVDAKGLSVEVFDELVELQLRGSEYDISKEQVQDCIREVFESFDVKFPGGQSAREVEETVLPVFHKIIAAHQNKTIVIGTHGIVMTLMLRSLDPQYGFDFWKRTSKPDVYRVVVEDGWITEFERVWRG